MATYPSGTYSPSAVNNGDVINAARENTQDAEITAVTNALLNGLAHAVTVSTGGLTVSTGNTVLGQNLSVAGTSTLVGAVTFSTVIRAAANPRALVYSTAALEIAADTWTEVTFESEEYDVGGLHSTASNPGRITVPTGSSGAWLISGAALFSTGGPGTIRNMRLLKNSTTEVLTQGVAVASSIARTGVARSGVVVLDAADFVTMEVFASGSTASFASAGTARRLAQELNAVRLW